MSGLFAALESAGNALRVFERSIGVTQNNVINQSTPGYARQQLSLTSLAFNPEMGAYGGVLAGSIESARSAYAETYVRSSVAQQGYYTAQRSSLSVVESVFALSGSGSVVTSLQELFDSFSAWSVNPGESLQRQNVLAKAETVAIAFQQSAASLNQYAKSMELQAAETAATINHLTEKVANINARIQESSGDSSLDTEMAATLEELSQLVGFSAVQVSDGTTTVLVAGQIPLVIGRTASPIRVDVQPAAAGAYPGLRVLDSRGEDITRHVNTGELGGLLSVRNGTIGSLLGDGSQSGALNELAAGVADKINALLTAGQVSTTPPVAGVPLFVVNPGAGAAASLAVSSTITASSLAAIDPGPPPAANGIALRLAGLSDPEDAAGLLDGMSLLDYYGQMASQVGHEASAAAGAQSRQEQLTVQARSLRSELSGVSLDQEAAKLLEFQRAYQATGQVVSVVNELMDTLLAMAAR